MSIRGVPSVTYVRIIGSGFGQGDIVSDGTNAITVLESGSPSTRHEVAQVLDKTLSDLEVCELTIGNDAGAGLGASLNPIAAFVNDAATVLIHVIGSRSTKKSLFIKKTFLPFLSNELFNIIGEKDHNQPEFYQAQVSLSSFEIQDEIITDLLRPSSRGLTVSISAEDGVIISGIYKELITDEINLRKNLMDSCENRSSHTLPLGASLDTSTGVWEIELRQNEAIVDQNNVSVVKKSVSRLIIVDIPCVDPLVQGGANLRQLESPTLHKSLLSFVDVTKRLSSPSRAALAPYRSSKLTNYLSEMLGGNAIVLGLGIIANGEPSVSRKTLEIIGALTNAVHFPIGGRELTEVLQGLLCKYRSLILQLQDEIINGAPMGEKSNEFSVEKIAQLQRDMAAALLDRNTAKEDRGRLFEMMELLKAKYNTIVKEKYNQSQELIKAEEDKLAIARAFVDLKLEHSKLQEQSEKQKFDLTSALLTSKNEYFDLDTQLLLAKADKDSAVESKVEIERILESKQEELIKVKAQLHEIREQLQREEDKNVELGAELLTLVNQREALQFKCNEIQNKLELAQVELAVYNKQGEDSESVISNLRSKMRQTEDELASTKKLLGETELELRRVTIDLDRLTKESEKTIETLGKSLADEKIKSEEQRMSLLKSAEEEKKKLQLEWLNKEASKGKKDIVEVIPLSEAQAQQRKLDRKIRDLEREILRYQEDVKVVQNDKNKAEKELIHVRQAFRNKLSAILTDSENTDLSGGKTVETDIVVQELLSSYSENEKILRAEMESTTSNSTTIMSALRNLFDKYRAAIDTIEDNLPMVQGVLDKELLNEQRLIGEAALNDANVIIGNNENLEKNQIRDRLQRSEEDALNEQQKATIILQTYKRNIENAEKKLAASRMEVANLHAQIRQLIDARDGANKDLVKQKQIEQQESTLKVLQEQLAVQLIKLNSPRPPSAGKPSNSTVPSNFAPVISTEDSSELIRNAKKNEAALKEAKSYIVKLEENANAAVVSQLRETEARAAKLYAQNFSVQEELGAYRDYMRAVVANYKKQIHSLKQQFTIPYSGNNKEIENSGTYDVDDSNVDRLPSISTKQGRNKSVPF